MGIRHRPVSNYQANKYDNKFEPRRQSHPEQYSSGGAQAPVAMDFSPPRNKSRSNSGKPISRRAQTYAAQHHPPQRDYNMPLQTESDQAQEVYVQAPQRVLRNKKLLVPKNKGQARHNYGNGRRNQLPNTKLPRNLSMVESKIKGQVARFKAMAKDRANYPMFNKDPVVYAKPRPTDVDYDPTFD